MMRLRTVKQNLTILIEVLGAVILFLFVIKPKNCSCFPVEQFKTSQLFLLPLLMCHLNLLTTRTSGPRALLNGDPSPWGTSVVLQLFQDTHSMVWKI